MTDILGIVNLSAESFADGGHFVDADVAQMKARAMIKTGATAIDLGPSSSHPGEPITPPALEIERLAPVFDALIPEGIPISVDSFHPETQRYAIARGVDFLNDIHGFAHPEFYPELAEAQCRLILMHSVHGVQATQKVVTDPNTILFKIHRFFEERLAALTAAGIRSDRIILDPGMGFFLSSEPEASLVVLQHLASLKKEFGLPILVGVSRKSFIQRITGKVAVDTKAGTLSAELYAAAQGVDWIRTHDVESLSEALLVQKRLISPVINTIKTMA